MRKLIALEFMSLDGVIQAPGRIDEDTSGDFTLGGWISPYSDPVLSTVIKKQMAMPFDLLLGRKTFDIWAGYWPSHSHIWPEVNTATKYVVSKTVTDHEWQPSTFINDNIIDRINKIKRQPGPDVRIYGSADLLHTLLKHGLVDELWLQIYPISLGEGKRLFSGGSMPTAFKLMECSASPKGVIIARYERIGAIQP